MAEATIKLANGTTITVSGSAEEVAHVAMLYSGGSQPTAPSAKSGQPKEDIKAAATDGPSDDVDLSQIANTIFDCEETEALEKHILGHSDVVNKIMMCLYINEKYFNSQPALTTGEISKILSQLGISVATSNVSLAISRKANKYVMKDNVTKKGVIIRYSINRPGKQYFEEVLSGENVGLAKVRSRKQPSKFAGANKTNPIKSATPTPKGKRSTAYKPKYNATLDLHGLDEFSETYKSNNNSEHLVVFLKFLTDKASIESISGDDIYTCFAERKSKIKLPGSFMDTLRNAQNRDHLIVYERGFREITLTPKGENLFNHDIAKREK
ncbi:hypothetical protein [Roseibium sp.]|uniref:hypothetical protein n=1 Tax=Roseibium sp. TaxID=1936156 RepID=UPI003BAAE456